jgi:hypothetical protein
MALPNDNAAVHQSRSRSRILHGCDKVSKRLSDQQQTFGKFTAKLSFNSVDETDVSEGIPSTNIVGESIFTPRGLHAHHGREQL